MSYPSVRICLPSDQRAPWVARQSIKLLEAYVPAEVIDDVNLLVSELVTNGVKYATMMDEASIALDAYSNGRALRVEVTNAGAARVANPLTRQSLQTAESGWGLIILTKIASRWGVTTNGETQVWFEIDLESGVAPLSVFAV
jgi:serine/threonine-protein kinase RsbW